MAEANVNNNIINRTNGDVFVSGIFKLKGAEINHSFVNSNNQTVYYDSVKINNGEESYNINCSAGSGVESLEIGKSYKFEFSCYKAKIKVIGIHEIQKG